MKQIWILVFVAALVFCKADALEHTLELKGPHEGPTLRTLEFPLPKQGSTERTLELPLPKEDAKEPPFEPLLRMMAEELLDLFEDVGKFLGSTGLLDSISTFHRTYVVDTMIDNLVNNRKYFISATYVDLGVPDRYETVFKKLLIMQLQQAEAIASEPVLFEAK